MALNYYSVFLYFIFLFKDINNMFIKLCGWTIIVRCENIEQKIIFILDFSFYANASSHGINKLSLYFTIKAVAQHNSCTFCTATPMGKFYRSAPFSFQLFFFICCRMCFLKKYNTRFLLPAPSLNLSFFLPLIREKTLKQFNLSVRKLSKIGLLFNTLPRKHRHTQFNIF